MKEKIKKAVSDLLVVQFAVIIIVATIAVSFKLNLYFGFFAISFILFLLGLYLGEINE